VLGGSFRSWNRVHRKNARLRWIAEAQQDSIGYDGFPLFAHNYEYHKMKQKQIGKIQFLNPRDLFPHEAHDFTVWLEQNIDVLADQIGLPLTVESREKKLGDFRADLICVDAQGNHVVVENQLEKSDHKHIGQVVTYLGVAKANTVIWITPEPRQEHIEAISNLNDITSEGYSFYMVQLQVIQVENSKPAVLFTLQAQFGAPTTPIQSRYTEQRPIPLDMTETEGDSEPQTASEQSSAGLPAVWCVYPRRDEGTYKFFLEQGVVGLGFGNLGDLSKLPPEKSAFRDAWEKRNPDQTPGQVRSLYPMFFSLAHRMQEGDLVIYPATWREPVIHVGRVTGPYQYQRLAITGYHDRRSVEWVAQLDRDVFSDEALRGISVTLALFQVRNEAFLAELAENLQ